MSLQTAMVENSLKLIRVKLHCLFTGHAQETKDELVASAVRHFDIVQDLTSSCLWRHGNWPHLHLGAQTPNLSIYFLSLIHQVCIYGPVTCDISIPVVTNGTCSLAQ